MDLSIGRLYLELSHSWPADDRKTTLGTLRRCDPRFAILPLPESLPDREATESLGSDGSREAATLPTRPSAAAAPDLSLLVHGDRLELELELEDVSSFTSAAFAGEGRPGLGDRVGVGGGTIA